MEVLPDSACASAQEPRPVDVKWRAARASVQALSKRAAAGERFLNGYGPDKEAALVELSPFDRHAPSDLTPGITC